MIKFTSCLPRGYVFLFRSEFFFRTRQELEYLFFLSCKAQICFPEFSIRLYDKISESDYFFSPPPISEYFFSATLGIRIFFWKKKHNPPSFQVKWSFPYYVNIQLKYDCSYYDSRLCLKVHLHIGRSTEIIQPEYL